VTNTSGQLAKAKITNLATNVALECMFNPSEYTFSRSNEWKSEDVPGQEIPKLTFAGGKSGVLTLKLIFDTNEQHVSSIAAGSDVRQITRKLWDMLKVVAATARNQGTARSAPPNVQFQWGRLWSVTAVITQIEETFTLFRPDGTPVRSNVSLSLQQLFPDDVYHGRIRRRVARPAIIPALFCPVTPSLASRTRNMATRRRGGTSPSPIASPIRGGCAPGRCC